MADKVFEYKGYMVSQCGYNHHVMIVKDGHMVYHASCTRNMSKKRLMEMVDWYIDFTSGKFDAIYNESDGDGNA